MIRKLTASVILGIVGVSLLPPTESSAKTCTIPPAAVAHRGGTERYVENTRDAFRDAANHSAATWETDVQFTADDQPVIMHDDTVDRTTNGTGPVSTLTLAQLEQLRTADDQPVPTLADLVNDAQVDGARVLVELKTTPTDAQWTTFLAALTSRTGMTSKLTITSFDGDTLLAAHDRAPAYATGLITELGDQSVGSVTQYGAHILIKHHNAVTWSRLAAWSAGGLTVYAWTVDTVSEWTRMNAYPAGWLDGIITNLPDGYLTWTTARTC